MIVGDSSIYLREPYDFSIRSFYLSLDVDIGVLTPIEAEIVVESCSTILEYLLKASPAVLIEFLIDHLRLCVADNLKALCIALFFLLVLPEAETGLETLELMII